jgi:hypothetical protein
MTDDEATVRATLRGNFEASFEDCVKRALEVRHNPIIPHSHFARASSECVEIYRLGYFVATAMATQAVAQGIVKFVAERNELGSNKDKTVLVTSLRAMALFRVTVGKRYGEFYAVIAMTFLT